MKKFQPERTDLLINSEWGKPKEELSPKEAQQQGLIMFKDRWVTAAERKELKTQLFTYRALRVVALLFALVAGYVAYLLIASLSRKVPVGAMMMFGILAAVYLATAVGLYLFKRWAYYAAIVLMLIGILQSIMARRVFFLLIAVLLVLFLIRKPVRKVFSRPPGDVSSP